MILPERRIFNADGYKGIVYTGSLQANVVLVGGNPKGYDIPFHPWTVSGNRLRKILAELKLDPMIIDLWDTQAEEEIGRLKSQYLHLFRDVLDMDGRLVCLGQYVFDAIYPAFQGTPWLDRLEYAPHPGSRNPELLKILKDRLANPPQWMAAK